ncbi:MAG: hypothetical protein WBQ94_25230 [Terracidiphilus sp.]
MRKWIAEVYRPAGFILLGALIGSGLTLAIQGRLSTPDIVGGVLWLLGFGIIVVNGRRSRALSSLAISLLWGGLAVEQWTHHRTPFSTIFPIILALIYASLAGIEHGERKKKRAEEIAQSI